MHVWAHLSHAHSLAHSPSLFMSLPPAALVKLLRKCLRELGSRTSLYVDQCIKTERDLAKQVSGVVVRVPA